MKRIKCLLIGDSGVGKTSLITQYTMQRSFRDEHVPTGFKTYFYKTLQKGSTEPINLVLWDIGGSSGLDRFRPLAYPDADVILICFSVVSQESFENIRLRWYPELRRFCPSTPFYLVGLKIDLLEDRVLMDKMNQEKKEPILHFEGVELAKRIGAYKYCECSAKTWGILLHDIFEKAICASVQYKFLKDEEFWEDHEDITLQDLF